MPESPSDERTGTETNGAASMPPRPESPPTPFDHPLFLPVLLFAGMLWFGYDGWLTDDPDMAEHQTFNRVGFVILTLATGWYGRSGLRDWKRAQEKARSEKADPHAE